MLPSSEVRSNVIQASWEVGRGTEQRPESGMDLEIGCRHLSHRLLQLSVIPLSMVSINMAVARRNRGPTWIKLGSHSDSDSYCPPIRILVTGSFTTLMVSFHSVHAATVYISLAAWSHTSSIGRILVRPSRLIPTWSISLQLLTAPLPHSLSNPSVGTIVISLWSREIPLDQHMSPLLLDQIESLLREVGRRKPYLEELEERRGRRGHKAE
jgi:hypothetical protein